MEEKKEQTEIPYSVLNEEERKIKPVKEKTKKSHKALAWFLGILAFAGGAYGAKSCYDKSDWKYNKEVKSAYEEVMDIVYNNGYLNIVGSIDSIRFYEPEHEGSPAHIEIFSTANDLQLERHMRYFYEVAYEYYQTLQYAEDQGDFKTYVYALNKCFQNMEKISEETSFSTTNFEFDENKAKKFNEFFNLNDYNLNQVGFLPQYVKFGNEEKDGTNHFTYTIKGLSFVEVEKGEGDYILPENMSNAVLSKKLNKKNIKVYETDFAFSYDMSLDLVYDANDFLLTLGEYFENVDEPLKHNLKVTPTYVKEVDLTSFKMQEGKFDFERCE